MRLALLTSLLLASTALAQSPQLLVRDGDKQHPVALAKADIRAVITGDLSRTAMTLTFKNDANRVLEGELVFPLPEGATVCAYALDVNGELVDAVTIGKEKARVAFETEVRRGIDPGLVEKVQGNNFRTRIYPIPANGTRTIRVEYVSDLVAADGSTLTYVLPLAWDNPVPDASIKLEVVKSPVEPKLAEGKIDNLAFAKWEDRFVAEQTLKDVRLNTTLKVALPSFPASAVAVEKRVRTTMSAENLDPKAAEQFAKTDYFFVLTDRPAVPADQLRPKLATRPAHVGVAWDASLSRMEVDHKRELALLQKHLAALGEAIVDVTVFRNVPDAPRRFWIKNGNADEVLKFLSAVTYDGGTSLATLQFGRDSALLDRGERRETLPAISHHLLFTDGLANLGPDLPTLKPEAPVFAIAVDPKSNHGLLRQLCAASGGAYLNLQRMTDDQALAGITAAPFSLLSVECDPAQVADVYPRGPQPVQGRITLAGKLLAPTAKVTLVYGFPGSPAHRVDVTLNRDQAADTAVVGRYWAQLKLADLSIQESKNEPDITALGKEFNLVTSYTSMIVLETVDQYLRHNIVPPKSRPQIYAQFMQQIESRRVAQASQEKAKIDRVLQMWNARVAWWDKKYEYAADFRYKAPEAKTGAVPRNGERPGTGPAATTGGVALGGEDAPATRRPAAEPGRPAPLPRPAAGSDLRDNAPAQQGQGRAHGGQPTPDARPAEAPAPAAPTGETAAANRPADTRAGLGSNAESSREWGELSPRARERTLQEQNADGLRRLEDRVLATKAKKEATGPTGTVIQIKEWSPDTPYLKALQAAKPEDAYGIYSDQSKTLRSSPAFYLDCADFFAKAGNKDLALRILTNIPELALDDGRLLRIAAHRLQQLGYLDLAIDLFEKVTRLRPEEPQSFRDLALALADRADAEAAARDLDRARSDYERSLSLLHKVVMNNWQRFEEIEVIALEEANRILARANSSLSTQDSALRTLQNPFDPRLIKLLDLDVRIVMTWDTDNTDIDLHVIEPSGEECFYGHNRTTIGALVSRDFTQGYGPEEYCLRKLMPGQYTIKAKFYGNRDQKLVGPTTVQATVITNFARPTEKRQSMTLRLKDAKDMVEIGTVTLNP